MIKVGFVSSAPDWHWLRQFPGGKAQWGEVTFSFSGDFADCDLLVVYDAVPERLSGQLRAPRRLFVASEPASVKRYDAGFLAQFDLVLTTDPQTSHANVRTGQLGLPWLIGAWDAAGQRLAKPMTADDFAGYFPPKTRQMSVVTSAKAFTAGHRQRLDFVRRLKAYFGDEIDLFGRDIKGFGDKSEVLATYRYHIALENCATRDYWTEKLADPLLALTYPIYYGCPNIGDYFAPGALTTIDIADFDGTVATIRSILASDRYEASRDHLVAARQRVLGDNNLFAILAGLAPAVVGGEAVAPAVPGIRNERAFEPWSARFSRKLAKQAGKAKRLILGDR